MKVDYTNIIHVEIVGNHNRDIYVTTISEHSMVVLLEEVKNLQSEIRFLYSKLNVKKRKKHAVRRR